MPLRVTPSDGDPPAPYHKILKMDVCGVCRAEVPSQNIDLHMLRCTKKRERSPEAHPGLQTLGIPLPPPGQRGGGTTTTVVIDDDDDDCVIMAKDTGGKGGAPPAGGTGAGGGGMSDGKAPVGRSTGFQSSGGTAAPPEVELSELSGCSVADARHALEMSDWDPNRAFDLLKSGILDFPGQMGGGASTAGQSSSQTLHFDRGLPWPSSLVWDEMKHKGGCKACDQGSFFFHCKNTNQATAHRTKPVPLAGQRIEIRRHGVTVETRVGGAFTPFTMGPFRGIVEEYDLGTVDSADLGLRDPELVRKLLPLGGGARAFVLRNFDGNKGRSLAKKLEDGFGLDVVSGLGCNLKCAAAQGNNCQDTYKKLHPAAEMFMDADHAEVVRDILDGAMTAASAYLKSRGKDPLDLSHGAVPRPGGKLEAVTGEAQILRFNAASGRSPGSVMHCHIDKKGSRWVAIMSLGDTGRFLLDNALCCERCFVRSRRVEDQKKEIVPNRNKGGFGVGHPVSKQLGYKDWRETPCPTCREIELRSGDVVLFHGAPESNVAHGSMGTVKGEALEGLPDWCKKGRVSVQYRMSAGWMASNGRLY